MSLRLSQSVVLIKDSPELRLPAFTIAFWFKLNTSLTSQTLFCKPISGPPWGPPFSAYLTRINSSASIEILHGDTSGTFQDWVITLSSSLQTGSWYHMAWSALSTTASWVMYLNGTQPIGDPLLRTPVIGFNAGPVMFGGDFGDVPFFDLIDGELSDMRLYNRRLTSDEIFRLYSSRGKYSSIVNGLVSYWPLDDGAVGSSASGSLIQDHKSNNHGTGSSTGAGFGRFNGEAILSYSNTNGM